MSREHSSRMRRLIHRKSDSFDGSCRTETELNMKLIQGNYDEIYRRLTATDKLVAECDKPIEFIRFTRIKLALMLTCLQEAQHALVKIATPREIRLLKDQDMMSEIVRRLENHEDASPEAVLKGVRNRDYLKPAPEDWGTSMLRIELKNNTALIEEAKE